MSRRKQHIRIEERFTHVYYAKQKRYGFFSFGLDILLTIVTGGFWLIWVFVREMRKR